MFAFVALLAVLVLLVLRPSPAISAPLLVPRSPAPRRVSFSSTDALPLSRSLSLPAPRRWSSPFHRRKHSVPASPDQLGHVRLDVQPSPKLSRRFPTPLRLPFNGKQRSSSASYSSTSVYLDQLVTPSPTPATRSPPQHPRFANPFTKHARSRTLSPPSSAGIDVSSSPSTGFSSPSHRQTFLNKLKSIFKSVPPEPSPIVRSRPIFTKFRRKPVLRTQPYGPPWNAPMPVPDFTISPHSLQKPYQTMSPRHTSQKHSTKRGSRSQSTPLSPGESSPRTFINELDEKLSQLQQQRIHDSISSPRR